MGIIGFLILGLIAGFLAGKIMSGHGYGIVMDMVLGIVGAFVGGFIASLLFGLDVTGFNITSLIIAFIGACIVLAIYKALVGRRATAST